MVGLSPLEKIVYFEILKLDAGFVSQWYDPMSRLFNAVFLPGIVWIIFLHFALSPFSKFKKGLKGLIAIGITVFGISNGFYSIWAAFAQSWFFLLIGISAFFFVVQTIITKNAAKNLITLSSQGLGAGTAGYSSAMSRYSSAEARLRQIDTQLEAISNQITQYSNQLNIYMMNLASASSPNQRAMISAQIRDIQNKMAKLQKQYDKLIQERGRAVNKLVKAEGKLKKIESLNPDRIS